MLLSNIFVSDIVMLSFSALTWWSDFANFILNLGSQSLLSNSALKLCSQIWLDCQTFKSNSLPNFMVFIFCWWHWIHVNENSHNSNTTLTIQHYKVTWITYPSQITTMSSALTECLYWHYETKNRALLLKQKHIAQKCTTSWWGK